LEGVDEETRKKCHTTVHDAALTEPLLAVRLSLFQMQSCWFQSNWQWWRKYFRRSHII